MSSKWETLILKVISILKFDEPSAQLLMNILKIHAFNRY